MPKSFAEVYDLYRQLGQEKSIPNEWSLGKFSGLANEAFDSQDFAQGQGSWFGEQLNKGNYWIDKGLDATGLPDVAGQAGRKLFESVGGTGDVGYEAGKAMPRFVADMLPTMLFPGARLAKLGTAALMGTGEYERTGSPLAATLSAASLPVMEAGGALGGKLAEKLGLFKRVAQTGVDEVGRAFTQPAVEGIGQKMAYKAAHTIGALGAQEFTNFAADRLVNGPAEDDGMSLYDKFLSIGLNVLPFEAVGAHHLVNGKPMAIGKATLTATEAPAVEPQLDVSASTEYGQKRAKLWADATQQKVKFGGDNDKLKWLQGEFGRKLYDLDVEYGHKFLPVSQATSMWDDLNAAFGYSEKQQPGVPFTMWTEANAGQVTDATSLMQLHNAAEHVARESGMQEPADGRDAVVEMLDAAGTPVTQQIATERSGALNTGVAKAKRGATEASIAGRKAQAQRVETEKLGQFGQDYELNQRGEQLHEDPEVSETLKKSLGMVENAFKNTESSKGTSIAVNAWTDWRKQYTNLSKRDPAIWGKDKTDEPLVALERMLAKRNMTANIKESKAGIFSPKAEDNVDLKVTKVANADLMKEYGDAMTRIAEARGLKTEDILAELKTVPDEQKLTKLREMLSRKEAVQLDVKANVDYIAQQLEKAAKSGSTATELQDVIKSLSQAKRLALAVKTKTSSAPFEMAKELVGRHGQEEYDEFVGSSGKRYFKTPAGGGFRYKLGDLLRIMPNGQKSFAGQTLDKDGKLPKATFVSKAGQNVSKEELALWEMLVPEAFEKDKVDVAGLAEKLAKMPVTEVKKLGTTEQSPIAKQYQETRDRWQHEMDTHHLRFENGLYRHFDIYSEVYKTYEVPEHIVKLGEETRRLNEIRVAEYNGGDATPNQARYSFLGPKSEQQMPGYVEGLVRVPSKPTGEPVEPGDAAERERKLDIKYQGPHFGSEDTNVLAFFRGYEETLPDGKKTFHVIEVQSDWGQKVRERKEQWKQAEALETAPGNGDWFIRTKNGASRTGFKSKEEAQAFIEARINGGDGGLATDHPLLSVYESLALKAAIDHARSVGADFIVLSDAETAMMTEGHDKAHKTEWMLQSRDGKKEYVAFDTKEEGEAYKASHSVYSKDPDAVVVYRDKPKQNAGMRLHYDRTLPDKLAKLTGDKGGEIELGLHDKAAENELGNEVGSPVFRDSKGLPKTQITGKMFSLEKVKNDVSLEEGFPLVGAKARSGSTIEQQGMEPLPSEPTFTDIMENNLRRTGFSEVETKYWTGKMQSIKDLTQMDHVAFGRLIDDANENVGGLYKFGKLSQVFLAAAKTGATRNTGHEMGATLAHELIGHGIEDLVKQGMMQERFAEDWNRLHEFYSTKPEEGLEFMKMFREVLPESVRDLPLWDEWLKETDPKEMMANTAAMWALGRVEGDHGKAFGLLAPPEARTWLKSITEYARRILGAIRGALGLKPHVAGELFRGGLERAVKTFDNLTQALKDGEVDVRMLERVANIGSDSVWDLRTSELSMKDNLASVEGSEDLMALAKGRDPDSKREAGLGMKVWEHLIQDSEALGQHVPAFKRVVGGLMNHPVETRNLAAKTMAPLTTGVDPETGSLTMKGQEAEDYKRIAGEGNQKVKDWFSKATQWAQRNIEDAYVYDGVGDRMDLKSWKMNLFNLLKKQNPKWPPGGTHSYSLHDEFLKLSKEDQKAAQNVAMKFMESKRVEMLAVLDSQKASDLNRLRFFFKAVFTDQAGNPTKSFDDVRQLGEQFSNAASKAMSVDPSEQMLGNKMLDVLNQQIGNPKIFEDALTFTAETQKNIGKLKEMFNPGHMSVIRRGKYLARTYDLKGNKVSDPVADEKDWEQWKKERRAEGFSKFDSLVATDEVQTVLQNSKELLGVLHQIEQQKNEQLKNLLPPGFEIPEFMLQDTSVAGTFARALAGEDIRRTAGMQGLQGGQRRLTPGNIDMAETQKLAANIVARLNAGQRMGGLVAFEMLNPELNRYPDELKRFKKMYKAYLVPDSETSRAITKYTAVMALGMHIPTHLMIGLDRIAGEAVYRGGGVVGSTVRIGKATKDIADFSFAALKDKMKYGRVDKALNVFKDPEERAFMKLLFDKGFFEYNGMNDFHDPNAVAAMDVNRIAQDSKLKPWYKAILSPINAFTSLSHKMLGASEHFGQQISALTGFRMARERMGQNYTRQVAADEAIDFLRGTTQIVGKAGRPLAQSQMGTIGNMAYLLSSYVRGWMNQTVKYVAHWRGADTLDLTPEQRSASRKAALSMLGLQLGSAGVLGLPFVGAGLKILELASGKALTSNIYTALGQILDDDSQDGNGLASLIMNGSANAALAKSGLPVDMGSKMQLGGVLGVSPYDGFSSGAVFGPTGGLVANTLAGFKSAIGGDYGDAAQRFAPQAFKKALRLWQNDNEVRTGSGLKVSSTGFDKVAYAMGFNPQTLSRLSQFEDFRKTAEAAHERQVRQEASEVLNALKISPQAGQEAFRALMRTSAKGENPQTVAKRVADQAAKQVFDADVRDGLQGATAGHLMTVARELGVQLPEAKEVMKESYVSEVMQMLGMMPQRMNRQNVLEDALGQDYTPFNDLRKPRRFASF